MYIAIEIEFLLNEARGSFWMAKDKQVESELKWDRHLIRIGAVLTLHNLCVCACVGVSELVSLCVGVWVWVCMCE